MGRKGKGKKVTLSQEEILELIVAAQNGSEEAEEKLILANERLIWKIAFKYIHRDIPQEDVFQIGVIGLIKCIRNFDVNFGVKFSTYAVPMIRGEIQRFLRDDYTVKVSRGIKDLAFRIRKNEAEGLSPEEVVIKIGMEKDETFTDMENAVKKVKEALDFIHNHSIKSTDDIMYSGGSGSEDITFGDMISEDVNGRWSELMEVRDAMKILTEKEQAVIELRYDKDLGQVDTAKRLGISQVQVSRLERKALATLKDALTKEEKPMAKKATGDRKRAVKLLRDTDMSLEDINEVTWVDMDKLGELEKKYRAKGEEVQPVKKLTEKPQPKVKKEPKKFKEEKMEPMRKAISEEKKSEALQLLKEGLHTLPEIEKATGLPYTSVWYIAKKHKIDIVKTPKGEELMKGKENAKKERQAANAAIQGGNVGGVKGALQRGVRQKKEWEMISQSANRLIQHGELLQSGASSHYTPDVFTTTPVVGQKSPVSPLSVGTEISPLRVGASAPGVEPIHDVNFKDKKQVITPIPIEKLQEMVDSIKDRDYSKEIAMLEAASKPAKSSFSLSIDLTANGNEMDKDDVIGKLEQLIRVVNELPTEKVNFNMKVNN